MDGSSAYESIFREMMQNKICIDNAMFYETFSLFLEAKGRLIDAFQVFHIGILRSI